MSEKPYDEEHRNGGEYEGDHDCGCGGDSGGVGPMDISAQTFDLAGSVREAVIVTEGGSTTRGQHQKKCPTSRLLLYVNLTAGAVDVTGDLVVDAKSCPVQLRYGGARFTAAPGFNSGITVTVPANSTLTGRCVKGRAKLCKWSFTRTSP